MTDDLEALLIVLPPHVEATLRKANRAEELVEIVLDLGRVPEARFTNGEVDLSDKEICREDLDYVVSRIGEFTTDNRAGIERTLHRISAIRNRKGDIVGLTCRVGRAVYGTIDIIQDIVESEQSILLLGRPGVGKTTLLREAARILAEKKRVIVVDTSNEIGGDGDIPHPAIGRARRMQVATPALQHEVMIEAVENHMPEVIIIDEIGRELEAVAARTIAERGVQLIGTAHGNTLDNLMMNPTLCDLIGGIQSVTLSDEEARRRGTQKSVLERKAPPTFDVVIEIQDRQRLIVHHNVAESVDALLRQRLPEVEVRYRDRDGKIHIERQQAQPMEGWAEVGRIRLAERRAGVSHRARQEVGREAPSPVLSPRNVFPYGIAQNRLRQAAQNLGVPLNIVEDLDEADFVMTLKNYYRKQPQPLAEAERRGIPIHVLRSNTVRQMEGCLADVFSLSVVSADPFAQAMQEAQEAIQKVLAGAEWVDLSPQGPAIRRQQHQLARAAHLISHSYGREPRRRVRIYRE
ncbi:MAG TPA: AAA family ATPase [Anaerolineae bacterium]|nr:AAA family ATPase [Anaerolineae bacterium]